MNKYKGKTAKQWYRLHEVMRRDFKRLLQEKHGSMNKTKPTIAGKR